MIRKTLLAALLLLAGCSGEQPKDAGKPDGYALKLAVTPAPDGKVQRLTLPPAALAALQRGDRGDFRLFDSSGRQLSLALDPSSGDAGHAVENAVPLTPIEMPASPGAGGVKVSVAQAGQDVTVDAATPGADQTLAAVLLDTRKLEDPASAVSLIIELPKDRLVGVNVEQSRDLKSWDLVASRQLVRFPGDDAADVRAAVPLNGAVLKDSYLRVSWQVASDVLIRTARVVTMKAAPRRPVTFATKDAQLIDPRTVAFRYPLGGEDGGSATRLRVTGSGKDGVLPLRLEGRKNQESPWQGWDGATLRDGQSVELAFPGAAIAEYRLVADPRSAGFFALPRIELLVDPMDLLVAFSGTPPYALAAGNKAAAPSLLAQAELLGASSPSTQLPTATIADTGPTPILSIAPTADDGPFSPKKLALWAALLAAVGVLGFAAMRLMASSARVPTD